MRKNKNIRQILIQSAAEFKSTTSICIAGILIALNILLGFVGQIKLSDVLEIRFDFLSIAVAGMLLGPVMGLAVGGLSDIFRTFIKGGNFFPGFTLNQMLIGFLFGLFFYYIFYNETKASIFLKTLVCNFIMIIVINFLMTTYWLHIMYGTPYVILLGTRLIKELLILPVNLALTYGVLSSVCVIYHRLRKKTS